MICIPCREQDHEHCKDRPRLAAARNGEIAGAIDVMAGRWCDCGHVTITDLSKLLGVKEVVE